MPSRLSRPDRGDRGFRRASLAAPLTSATPLEMTETVEPKLDLPRPNASTAGNRYVPRWVALTALCVLAIPAAFAQAPGPDTPGSSPPAAPTVSAAARTRVAMTRETAEERRKMFEQGWPVVEATIKRWQSLVEVPRDFRSVAPAFDFKGYVFTKEDRKTLDARRAEAQRQFDGEDWPGAILMYGTLIQQANDVVARLGDTGGYWLWYVNHGRRMERWRKTVRSNDLANPKGAEIQSVESRLEAQVRANQFGGPSKALMSMLDQLFKQAVADARAAAPGGVLRDDPLRRVADKPCADGQPDMFVPPSNSGMTPPRIDMRRSKSIDGYYPLIARYNGIEGFATVRALTSSSGCIVYAEVVKSSGSDLLDDAALDWTVEGAVVSPALGADHNPVPFHFQFNARFKLTN